MPMLRCEFRHDVFEEYNADTAYGYDVELEAREPNQCWRTAEMAREEGEEARCFFHPLEGGGKTGVTHCRERQIDLLRDTLYKGNQSNKAVVLPGITIFSDVLIASAQSAGCRFDGAVFNGGLTFNRVTMDGPLVFSGVRFVGAVQFTEITLDGAVSFVDATFKGMADLKGLAATDRLDLSGAVLEIGLDLSGLGQRQPVGAVVFNGGRCAGRADFTGAHFGQGSRFLDFTFESDCVFEDSWFLSNTVIGGVEVFGEANFKKASFGSHSRIGIGVLRVMPPKNSGRNE